MSDEYTPPETAPVNSEPRNPVPTVLSPTFQTVYSNAVSMVRTPWDIRVNFGLTKARDPEIIENRIPMVNEQQFTVIMSPHHAKVLAYIFLKEVKMWEQEHGRIPLKRGFLERLGVEVVEEDVGDPQQIDTITLSDSQKR